MLLTRHALAMPGRLWANRSLIWQLTRREIGQRYRGSYLGILWSLVTPLLMLAIYTFVFSVVFKARWQSEQPSTTEEAALIIFAGLAAFNLFSEAVNRAPNLILAVPNYVKKVVFPLEILPLVIVGSTLVNSLIMSGLVIVGNLVLAGHVSNTLLLMPLAYIPLVLLTLGLSWFLASLGVYVRDFGQGISIIVQVLFFLSPIFYPIDSLPEGVRLIMALNPMSFVLMAFRQTLIWGQVFDWGAFVFWTLFGLVLSVLGYAWFMQTKKGFADVL